MTYLIIVKWQGQEATETNQFQTLQEVNAWFDKNGADYPKAFYGELPDRAKVSDLIIDGASKTFIYKPVARLTAYVNKYRKEVGDGPATFQGITVNGDDKTRTAIAETVQFWQELDPEDAPATIDWEGPKGFHQISLSTLIGLGKAIGFQRQKSFTVKKAVLSKIESGQITTIEQAKAAFDQGMAS
jgi:hypothetical protein